MTQSIKQCTVIILLSMPGQNSELPLTSNKHQSRCKMSVVHPPSFFHFKHFFMIILLILLLSFVTFFIPSSFEVFKRRNTEHVFTDSLINLPEVALRSNSVVANGRNNKCNFYNCFNVYRCGYGGSGQIHVYVYPFRQYVDDKGNNVGGPLSKEYYTLLKTIVASKYYTSRPEEACIFIPSIDTLNQNKFNLKQTSQALAKLPL